MDDDYDNEPIIGIDLGTTFYCVGIYRHHQVIIIPNYGDDRIIPTQFFYYKSYLHRRRKPFKNYEENSNQQIIFPKILIGRNYNDPEIQKFIKKSLLINIIKEENSDKPQYCIINKDEITKFSVDDIYTEILKTIKRISEDFLGKEVNKALITVPVYFNNEQREATKNAAKKAGLHIIDMIYEPTAAVIAYGLNEGLEKKKILIFNLDNDIPDITIMEVYNNHFTVLFSQKNENLNGNKIIDLCTEYLLEIFKEKNNLDDIDFYNENNKKEYNVIRKLKASCEKIRYIYTSFLSELYIALDPLYQGIEFDFSLILRGICNKFFQKYINFLNQSLHQANLEKKDINNIIIYGELSPIFELKEMIYKYFDVKLRKELIQWK